MACNSTTFTHAARIFSTSAAEAPFLARKGFRVVVMGIVSAGRLRKSTCAGPWAPSVLFFLSRLWRRPISYCQSSQAWSYFASAVPRIHNAKRLRTAAR